MNSLFFELIRVAIGTQESLSRLPSEREWGKLYKMAQKQSLVGVCFAGLQRLGADADDPSTGSGQEETFARIGMSEELYLNWMGNTFMIQQKNSIVNQQCVALQKRLSAYGLRSCILKGQGVALQNRLAADGFRSCILKGQGVASLYSEHLLGLRQSGDIDLYVDCGRNEKLEAKVLEEILRPRLLEEPSLPGKVVRFFRGRWKYRMLFRESILLASVRQARAYLNTKGIVKGRNIWKLRKQER